MLGNAFVARISLTNYVYIQGIFDTYTCIILLLLGNLVAPSPQAENVDVCINMAPMSIVSLQSNLIATLLTGNKKAP